MSRFALYAVVLSTLALFASTFTFTPVNSRCRSVTSEINPSPFTLSAHKFDWNDDLKKKSTMIGKSAAALMTAVLLSTAPVNADEYGRETEADTLFTGETEMICTKRGPLGACLKTEYRTSENDNDKAEKYFRTPSELVKRKDLEARSGEDNQGNALIERLRQQSEENREKNELLVQQKTLMNDQGASFGPFDSQVLILNEDGKGFTLLANPQAMRLKNAGLIKDKRFIRQPTQEELDAALESEPNIIQRFFGE